MNRLTKITAPDNSTTQFAYDTRGRRISVTDANGKTTAYEYDDADRLVAVTDAAQNSTIYGYDTENNMVGITDAANHQTAFAYDALGRVTQVTFPSTLTEGYTYDAVNNLLSKTDRKNQTIQYGYDALYRLTSKTYPDSTAVNYTYDPLSRLTQVTDPTGTYSFTYDNLGRLLGTGTQYSFLSGTLTNSYAYDAASNRTSLTTSESGITYGYDSLNRLTSLTDSTTGQFGFGYDALGRRTSLTRPNGVGTSYSYDIFSNLLSVLHNGGSLPGSASYTYDAAGNKLTKTAVQSGDPNPVSVLSEYSYDPVYELTQAVTNSTLAESYSYDTVGNRLSSAGPTSYTYNTSNELISTYAYDSFGKQTGSTGSVTNHFQYAGREFDSETGLYYHRARYYDPSIGRFLSNDPIGMAGGINFYRYVDNSPISGTDPSGLWSPLAHDAMIQHALAPCGICQDVIDAIKIASRAFDDRTGTDPSYANFHAMAMPGQTPQKAIDARNDIIAFQMDLARDEYSSDRSQALEDFAVGIHTMMDFTSPAHTDNNGNPIMWCGLAGCKGNRSNVLKHSPNDSVGIERTADITRAIFAVEDYAIRGAFMYMTGNYNLNCKK